MSIYNVIRFKDNSYMTTSKSLNYFRLELNPILVEEVELENYLAACDLSKELNKLSDPKDIRKVLDKVMTFAF